MNNNIIGIDISKHFFDICILPCKKFTRFPNNIDGFKDFLLLLEKSKFDKILMEDTGCYHKALYNFLHKHYDNVFVINPKRIRDFAKSIGRLAKTDTLDAYVIALYGEKMDIIAKMMRSPASEKLRSFVVRRKQLINLRKQEHNHIETCLDNSLKSSIRKIIKSLDKEIKIIEQSIQKIIQSDEYFKSVYNCLIKIRGVGNVLITTLLCDLPELGYLNKRQIAALAGVAPMNCDSGAMRGSRHIQGGRFDIRKALYMAAVSSTINNPVIKIYYSHLKSLGKPSKVALVACMRKLLIHINSTFYKEFIFPNLFS